MDELVEEYRTAMAAASAEEAAKAAAQDAMLAAAVAGMEHDHPADEQSWAPRQWGYCKDAIVTASGKRWRSTVDFNVWEPGVSGWREEPEDGGPAAWIQPTGAHDAYSEGDRVLHLGKLWINVHPGERTNVWEPGVYGWEIDE